MPGEEILMHFYRRLKSIRAITFDLDDTLYDNYPIILKTTKETHRFLQKYHPNLHNFSVESYRKLRDLLLMKEPNIYYDATEWRRRTVELAMLNVGFTKKEAQKGSNKVMKVFSHWRSQIIISPETHIVLDKLAKLVPLAAITNGNADPSLFGLDRYFQFVLRAGLHGRPKPYRDMYHLASKKLNIAPENILHVGDNLTTDVAGAVKYGMQACWINLCSENLDHIDSMHLLPHVEIAQLKSLMVLF